MYPRSPADLTASSLGRALSIDPSSIASVETELIGQGVGILCQVARVRLAYRDGAPGPKSVVAKFPAAIEQTRGLARQFKFYEREVNFYKHLAQDVSLPSPRCFHASHDVQSDDFLLLLEDLGDRRLGDQLKGCPAEDAFAAVRELASFHAEWWDSPKVATIDWVPLGESELNKGGLFLYSIAWERRDVRRLPCKLELGIEVELVGVQAAFRTWRETTCTTLIRAHARGRLESAQRDE